MSKPTYLLGSFGSIASYPGVCGLMALTSVLPFQSGNFVCKPAQADGAALAAIGAQRPARTMAPSTTPREPTTCRRRFNSSMDNRFRIFFSFETVMARAMLRIPRGKRRFAVPGLACPGTHKKLDGHVLQNGQRLQMI